MDNHDNLVSDFAQAFEYFTEFTPANASIEAFDWAISAARATAIVKHRERKREMIRNMIRNQSDGQS